LTPLAQNKQEISEIIMGVFEFRLLRLWEIINTFNGLKLFCSFWGFVINFYVNIPIYIETSLWYDTHNLQLI